MSGPGHLDVEDLLGLARLLGAGPVGDVGLLEAAAWLHLLVRNHAFGDGTRRFAWLAAVVLLDLNGHTVDLDEDGVFEPVTATAQGHLDVEQLAQRLAPRPM